MRQLQRRQTKCDSRASTWRFCRRSSMIPNKGRLLTRLPAMMLRQRLPCWIIAGTTTKMIINQPVKRRHKDRRHCNLGLNAGKLWPMQSWCRCVTGRLSDLNMLVPVPYFAWARTCLRMGTLRCQNSGLAICRLVLKELLDAKIFRMSKYQ